MDTDISHAVEQRLAAIEARLDVLDGGAEEVDVIAVQEIEEDSPEPQTESTVRSRSRSRTHDVSGAVSESPEGGVA